VATGFGMGESQNVYRMSSVIIALQGLRQHSC